MVMEEILLIHYFNTVKYIPNNKYLKPINVNNSEKF